MGRINIADIKPGKVYSFWDDGKRNEYRQFVAMVTRIIPFAESKNLRVWGRSITQEDDEQDELEGESEHLHPLCDYWDAEHKTLPNLWDDEPEFFVEAAVPQYDNHILYFAPCWKGSGLFSFAIQDSWQCGLLDIYNDRIADLRDDLKEKVLANHL